MYRAQKCMTRKLYTLSGPAQGGLIVPLQVPLAKVSLITARITMIVMPKAMINDPFRILSVGYASTRDTRKMCRKKVTRQTKGNT